MSAQQSSPRLRNRVHSQLTALHQGGQFAVPHSVERYLSDQVIDEIAHEYRSKCPDAPAHGRAAIITAGVPGAGKSFAIDMLATDHRRIDPDGIKDLILMRLDRAGLLDIRHNHVLADGKPVHPRELALWVHDASTEAANRVRAVSLRRGENFIMEGTLSWTPLINSYVTDLASDDYERLTIVDVEVPFTLAVEQSKHRWWTDREAGRTLDDVELGGRFIAEASLEAFTLGSAASPSVLPMPASSGATPTMPASKPTFLLSVARRPVRNTGLGSDPTATSTHRKAPP